MDSPQELPSIIEWRRASNDAFAFPRVNSRSRDYARCLHWWSIWTFIFQKRKPGYPDILWSKQREHGVEVPSLVNFLLVTGLPLWQTQSESGFHFVVFIFFSVSGTALPVTSLLSSVFVHRVFSAYFVRFEGGGVICRFPWCTQENV